MFVYIATPVLEAVRLRKVRQRGSGRFSGIAKMNPFYLRPGASKLNRQFGQVRPEYHRQNRQRPASICVSWGDEIQHIDTARVTNKMVRLADFDISRLQGILAVLERGDFQRESSGHPRAMTMRDY